jgi:hypothetical protein
VSNAGGKRTVSALGETLFVALVTEVFVISREPNLRFERICVSRRFLWKSFSSFPFCPRHDCRRGLVEGYPKLASFGPRPLFDSVRHFIVKHTPFESVLTSNDSILHRVPSKKSFNQNRFSEQIDYDLHLCDDRTEQEQGQISVGYT